MESSQEANDFGKETYWNRPSRERGAGRSRNRSASPNLAATSRQQRQPAKSKSPKRSPSPTSQIPAFKAMMSANAYGNGTNFQQPQSPPSKANLKSQQEEDDEKDEKSFLKLVKNVLPQFSNESDWEMAIFELVLILERVWPHKDKLNIKNYMTNQWHNMSSTGDIEGRADRLIYFALTVAAKKDSYAKLQIMAASHTDAVPCVMTNEGKKLYEMFQALFTMTNLHQASLPTVRQEFYAITQKEDETVLKYTSRVDVIVATLAKLGERVSTGAWIYALGNGLQEEFKESKDGILYNKMGYDTVISVKRKILSEEAVLTSKTKKSIDQNKHAKEKDDDIALKLQEAKEKNTKEIKEQLSLMLKGKGSNKGSSSNKGKRKWNESADQNWNQNWNQSNGWNEQYNANWNQPAKGKGKGKSSSKGKKFDPQTLWCDIHQKHGHSTDYCFENPNRTGGKPISEMWCDICSTTGHTTSYCFDNPERINKGKGKPYEQAKGWKGKSNKGNRQWKSQNFPADYKAEQATPVLHDESSSKQPQEWWNTNELGSVCFENEKQKETTSTLKDEYDDDEIAAQIDLFFVSLLKLTRS